MQHSISLTKPEQSFGFAKSSGFIQKESTDYENMRHRGHQLGR